MSPARKSGWRDSTTSLTVCPHITSCRFTDAAYDGPSLIRPRMYGSSERYVVRRRTSPSLSAGIGPSTVSKLSAVGMPAGRDFRRIWRFMMTSTLEDQIPLIACPLQDPRPVVVDQVAL